MLNPSKSKPSNEAPWLQLGQLVQELVGASSRPSRVWGRRAAWQVQVRWLVAPLMILTLGAGRLLGFHVVVLPIVVVAVVVTLYNAGFAWSLRHHATRLQQDPRLDRYLTILGVVADYVAMLLLLHFTGGVWSPLVVFLLFHVIIAAIQFRPSIAFMFAAWATTGLWLMLAVYAYGLLRPTPITYRGYALHSGDRWVDGAVMLLFLTVAVFIIAIVVTHIMRTLRRQVGQLAAATSNLRAANEKLSELMEERSRFMLEVAHNLRAPLGASVNMLELVRDGFLGDISDKQAEQLLRVDERLRGQHAMIGELLTIAHAGDWSREIPDVIVDLRRLAAQIEQTFRGEAERKGLRFDVVCGDDLPQIASGANLLEQMMENLVSNAIKYTPGPGEVEVRFERIGRNTIRIVVRDSGIGIPEAEQGKLFREFFRATNAKRHSTEGTGLGLALVKQTVERHGGRVGVSSAEGQGTTIEVELPTERPDRAEA